MFNNVGGNTGIYDSKTTTFTTVEPFGGLRVAPLVRLIGGNFDGAALDSNRWASTFANGGTAAVSGNIVNVRTNGTADGSSIVRSTRISRHLAGTNNVFISSCRLNDTGTANNTRKWGMGDGTNGAYFKLNGTTFSIVTLKAGAETAVNSGSFNGDVTTVTMDTNFHVYEILFNDHEVRFYRDRVFVHKVSSTTASYSDIFSFKIQFENTNSSSSTSDVQFFVRGGSIYRFGDIESSPAFYNVTTNETKTLKTGPGRLHRVVVNKKGTSSGEIKLYDSTTGSGTVIALVDSLNLSGTFEYNVDFSNGLTYVTVAAPGDITVVYD